MTTNIDTNAPAVAEGSIHIEASPAVVWETISDIGSWPRWNPDVAEASLEGALAPESTFTWKAGPGRIRSTLVEVDPPRNIAWTGKTMGIHAIHVWHIEPVGDGVELTTRESWTGLPVRLFRSAMQKTLDRALATGLQSAKQEAEAVS
jgi:hypothetical protein